MEGIEFGKESFEFDKRGKKEKRAAVIREALYEGINQQQQHVVALLLPIRTTSTSDMNVTQRQRRPPIPDLGTQKSRGGDCDYSSMTSHRRVSRVAGRLRIYVDSRLLP
uniref:Uncharacterized protein n=1 Tax=Vespula pensylvanica TaxID=30213 RepID=A0A834NQ55_VESPE|nr:hypothetical protein H0235_012096 [Vespula pensylvanica]